MQFQDLIVPSIVKDCFSWLLNFSNVLVLCSEWGLLFSVGDSGRGGGQIFPFKISGGKNWEKLHFVPNFWASAQKQRGKNQLFENFPNFSSQHMVLCIRPWLIHSVLANCNDNSLNAIFKYCSHKLPLLLVNFDETDCR